MELVGCRDQTLLGWLIVETALDRIRLLAAQHDCKGTHVSLFVSCRQWTEGVIRTYNGRSGRVVAATLLRRLY